MKYLINETGTIDCLNYFGRREPSPGLPSWALNWAAEDDCQLTYFFFDHILPDERKIIIQDGNQGAAKQDFARDDELSLWGYNIATVGPVCPERGFNYFGNMLRALDPATYETIPDQGQMNGDNTPDTFAKMFKRSTYVRRSLLSNTNRELIQFVLSLPGPHVLRGGVVVPSDAVEGDLVVILDGSPLHFILRVTNPSEDSPVNIACRLVGAAWFWLGSDTVSHYFRFDT